MGKKIGAVVGNIDGKISDNLNAVFVCVILEVFPLSEKKVLQLFVGERRFLVVEGYSAVPFAERFHFVLLLERHVNAVIGKPELVFKFKA